MFEQCNILKQLDLSMLFYQNKVKNSSFIANRCENLESAKIGTGNLSIGMFNQCPNLKELDIDLPTKEIHNLIENNVLYYLSPLAQGLLTAEKYRRQNLSVMEDLEERIDDMTKKLANRCGDNYKECITNLPEAFLKGVDNMYDIENYVSDHVYGHEVGAYEISKKMIIAVGRITSSLMDRIEDLKSIASLIALKDMSDEIDIEKIDLDEYLSEMKKLNYRSEHKTNFDGTIDPNMSIASEIKNNAMECVNNMYQRAIETEID